MGAERQRVAMATEAREYAPVALAADKALTLRRTRCQRPPGIRSGGGGEGRRFNVLQAELAEADTGIAAKAAAAERGQQRARLVGADALAVEDQVDVDAQLLGVEGLGHRVGCESSFTGGAAQTVERVVCLHALLWRLAGVGLLVIDGACQLLGESFAGSVDG